MNDYSKIPIKNIYYMLSYAWNVLEQSNNVCLGSEKFDNIYNLFARIYITGVNNLIKRGFNRYYKQNNEAISTPKGKINVTRSIKELTFNNGRLICQYDDFSSNIKLNQIIKSTINILVKYPHLDKNLRHELFKLQVYFTNIEPIYFTKSLFSTLRFNKNNYHYRILINISELIYYGLIANESDGNILFLDFVRDNQMAKLYEKFVLNFYRKHLSEATYYVHAPKLNWNLDGDISFEDLSLLPEMRTDIVIVNKDKNTQLIIDTKFYAQTLVSSNWTEIEKIRTTHLYQIMTYVNNSNFNGQVKGMLLYPKVEKELNVDYSIMGKKIGIRTLNLNSDWDSISNRLLSFVLEE